MSSDDADDLLRELGRVAREQTAEEDPRWERLARGELTSDEEAAIRRQAEGDPEVALRYEAYRPLDRDAKDRIAARLTGTAGGGRVVPIRRWQRVAAVALPLAAAAAIALWVGRRSPEPAPIASLDTRLPDYSLVVRGGDRATRSAEAPQAGGPVEVHRDSRLELVLRPSTAVTDGVAVRAFLVQDGAARAWNVPMQRSEDGAVRVAGAAGPLLGVPAGTWNVAFAVGREASLPAAPEAVARAVTDPAAPRPWQLLVQRVTLVDAP